MKIKNIKGIVEKIRPILSDAWRLGHLGKRVGCSLDETLAIEVEEILNDTDIDASECCEVDVLAINSILERHTDLLTTCIRTRGEVLMLASKAIAKAGIIKWKEVL